MCANSSLNIWASSCALSSCTKCSHNRLDMSIKGHCTSRNLQCIHSISIQHMCCWVDLLRRAHVLFSLMIKAQDVSNIKDQTEENLTRLCSSPDWGLLQKEPEGRGLSLQNQPHQRKGTQLSKKTLIKHFMHLPGITQHSPYCSSTT